MPTMIVSWVLAALFVQQPAPSSAPTLDYEFFKARVQPIFLAKRDGHARCYSCHSQGTTMRLQPLSPGSATWNEGESRKNFEAVVKMVMPGDPIQSRLLMHPLSMDAGGTLFHNGGKHFATRDNAEWKTMADWVRGQKLK
jgi:hypothetical protein